MMGSLTGHPVPHHPRPIPFNQFGLEQDEKQKIKLTSKDLLVLVRYKRMKGDQPMPKGVTALCTRWNNTKHRASPRCSPNNSDDEEEGPTKKRRTSMTRSGGRWAQLDESSGMTKVKTRVMIKNT
jgi:hypothetical protein